MIKEILNQRPTELRIKETLNQRPAELRIKEMLSQRPAEHRTKGKIKGQRLRVIGHRRYLNCLSRQDLGDTRHT